MSERHTAEPWLVTHQSGGDWDVVAGTNIGVGMCVATCGKCLADDCGPGANAGRIVACVNAMAGVADPAAELAALRAERDELRVALNATMHAVDLALCGTPSAHYFTELKARLGGEGYTLEDNLKLNMADIKGACAKARNLAVAALARAERSK